MTIGNYTLCQNLAINTRLLRSALGMGGWGGGERFLYRPPKLQPTPPLGWPCFANTWSLSRTMMTFILGLKSSEPLAVPQECSFLALSLSAMNLNYGILLGELPSLQGAIFSKHVA